MKDLFERLVEAIRQRDGKTLQQLRESSYPAIAEYVREHNPKPELSREGYAALVVWLSTPPDQDPMPALHVPESVLRERERRLGVTKQLFATLAQWRDVGLLDRILEELAQYEDAPRWHDLAAQWFAQAPIGNALEGIDEDAQIDLINGYGGMVEQIILRQRLPVAAGETVHDERFVTMEPSDDGPCLVLRLWDGTPVRTEVLADAMFQHSGVPLEQCKLIAAAISFALPVCPDVLPTVTFEPKSAVCQLRLDGSDLGIDDDF